MAVIPGKDTKVIFEGMSIPTVYPPPMDMEESLIQIGKIVYREPCPYCGKLVDVYIEYHECQELKDVDKNT